MKNLGHVPGKCEALEYGKTTKAADVVRHLCSRENYAQKYQLSSVHAACTPVIGPRTLEKMTTTLMKGRDD